MTHPAPHPALAAAALVRWLCASITGWFGLRRLFDREFAAMQDYITDTLRRFEALLHAIADGTLAPERPTTPAQRPRPKRALTRAATQRLPALRRPRQAPRSALVLRIPPPARRWQAAPCPQFPEILAPARLAFAKKSVWRHGQNCALIVPN